MRANARLRGTPWNGDAEQLGEFGGGVVAGVVQRDEVCLLGGRQLRSFAPQSPLGPGDLHALAGAHLDEVGLELARTLNSSRPTGSVGSWTDPPRLSFTCRPVSSSAMVRASGSERASRSSLVTTRVSPARHAASASRSPGRSRVVPVSPWST